MADHGRSSGGDGHTGTGLAGEKGTYGPLGHIEDPADDQRPQAGYPVEAGPGHGPGPHLA